MRGAWQDWSVGGVRRVSSGFTLIELLVVVTVIGILMGLVLGVAEPVQESGKRARAQAEVAGLETALTRFEQDTGFYPNAAWIQTLAGDRFYAGQDADPNKYIAASRALFLAVTGRQWLNSTDVATMGTQYMEVRPNQVPPDKMGTSGSTTNKKADQFTSYDSELTEGSYLLDPWANPYGYFYRATPTGSPPKHALNNVSMFDLWTTGGRKENPSDGAPHILRTWIANWPTDF